MLVDPKGAGHGWPAFSDRARMASRKIPERLTGRVSSVGEALSFAYFSLLASSMLALRAGFAVRASRVGQQRKVSRSPAGEWKLCFCSWPPQPTLKQHQTLSSADAAEFISFAKRQKKRNQRKTLPRRSTSGASFVPGFFDSPSMARSKNAAHPCAAPSGSAVCHDHSSASRSNSQSQSQSQSQGRSESGSGSRRALGFFAGRMTREAARRGPNTSAFDRHSREGGNPAPLVFDARSRWIPGLAGTAAVLATLPGCGAP